MLSWLGTLVFAGKTAITWKNLLEKPLPPKGFSFPKIKGPKREEHVCVVGAGPAGIHMSVMLKRKGYSNISIFEKTGRVGGKCFDSKIDGLYRPQGGLYLTEDYFNNFVKFAQEYGVGEVLEVPGIQVPTISYSTIHVSIIIYRENIKN